MKATLNIAYLALSEQYGSNHAGFSHTYNITKSLGKYCNRVNVFFLNDEVGFIKKEGNTYYHGIMLPSSKNLFKIFKFIKSYSYIKKLTKNADLIYERFHVNPIDLLFVKNKKYILEMNDPAMVLYSGIKGKIYRILVNKKIDRANGIITQTITLKNLLNKFTNKRIDVVSNGVDTKLFNPNVKTNIRKEFGIKDSEILVMFSGGFMQWHGVQDVTKLAKDFNEVKFMLVGDGPLFEELENKSKKLKNIILAGSKKYEEIPKYLQAADILIAPFNTERFKHLEEYGFWWCPVKLFEYMAMGKSILSYDYDEIKAILKNGGITAKSGDLKDFENKLEMLINNKKLRIELGKTAKKISLEYTWEERASFLMKFLIIKLNNK